MKIETSSDISEQVEIKEFSLPMLIMIHENKKQGKLYYVVIKHRERNIPSNKPSKFIPFPFKKYLIEGSKQFRDMIEEYIRDYFEIVRRRKFYGFEVKRGCEALYYEGKTFDRNRFRYNVSGRAIVSPRFEPKP